MWGFDTQLPLFKTAPPPRPIARVIGLGAEIIAAIQASSESSRQCAARFRVAPSTVVRVRNGQISGGRTRRSLSDDEIDLMRVRHEECNWSLTQCATFYGLPKSTVCYLLKYRRR